MDIFTFSKMLSDQAFPDLKKLRYRYPDDFDEFLRSLKELSYKPLPLKAFDGTQLVYLEHYAGIDIRSVKLLLREQREDYGVLAAENEIYFSSAIEGIDFNRDSIRNILKGFAPRDEAENRILGQKKGLELITDPGSAITEENLFRLYQMMVGDFLTGEDRLPEGAYYRNDAVYVVSDRIEHTGLDHRRLPEYMKTLLDFITAEDGLDELLKAAMIHFYIAYLHPYFDGNGRMARMVQLWYLFRRGYRTALFVPFSALIAKSRGDYYRAFTLTEKNRTLSGVVDVTPFLCYFAAQVYNRMPEAAAAGADTLERYREAVRSGLFTKKETELWRFVLSRYGDGEFSTKQLERDFACAAYATVRAFARKCASLGLLETVHYGNRTGYRIR